MGPDTALSVKTHVITDRDQMPDDAGKYALPICETRHFIHIVKIVACSQKRAVP
jgi:hypothetical protein